MLKISNFPAYITFHYLISLAAENCVQNVLCSNLQLLLLSTGDESEEHILKHCWASIHNYFQQVKSIFIEQFYFYR